MLSINKLVLLALMINFGLILTVLLLIIPLNINHLIEGVGYAYFKDSLANYNKLALNTSMNPELINLTLSIINDTDNEFPINKIIAINDWVAKNVIYRNDYLDEIILYPRILTRGGDCEDFSILESAMLIIANVTNKILITEVEYDNNTYWHAVVIAKSGNTWYELNPYDDCDKCYAQVIQVNYPLTLISK